MMAMMEMRRARIEEMILEVRASSVHQRASPILRIMSINDIIVSTHYGSLLLRGLSVVLG